MKKSNRLYLVLCFCLLGCGTQLTVSSKGCRTNATWGETPRYPDFTIRETFWIPYGYFTQAERTLLLAKYFEKRKIDCKNLDQINMTIERTWADVLLSLNPFVSSRTITISGLKKGTEEAKSFGKH